MDTPHNNDASDANKNTPTVNADHVVNDGAGGVGNDEFSNGASTTRVKSAVRFVGRAAIRFTCALIVFFMFVHLAVAAIFVGLGTPKGQAFVRAQIEHAFAEAGYKVTYGALYYSAIEGMGVTRLKIADDAGPVLEAGRISLRVGMLPLAARHLGVRARFDPVVFYRMPQSSGGDIAAGDVKHDEHAKELDTAEAAFVIPDLFFKTVSLDVLARFVQPNENPVAWMPSVVSVHAGANLPAKEFTLDELLVRGDAYEITGGGVADLHPGGKIDVQLHADANDLHKVIGKDGQATAIVTLRGPFEDVTFNLDAMVSLLQWRDAGLPQVNVTALLNDVTNAPHGTFAVTGEYQGEKIGLTASVAHETPHISVNDIQVVGPGVSGSGVVAYDTMRGLADGNIEIIADKLSHYAALLGADLAGAVRANITAAPMNDAQSLTLAVSANGVQYNEVIVDKATLNAVLNDVASGWPQDLDASVSGLVAGAHGRVDSLTVALKHGTGGNYAMTVKGRGDVGAPVTVTGNADLSGVGRMGMPDIDGIDLRLNIGAGGAVRVRGSVINAIADVNAEIKGVTGGMLPTTVQAILPPGVRDVVLSGSGALSGPMHTPVIDADMAVTANDFTVTAGASYKENVASVKLNGTGPAIKVLHADVTAPIGLSLYPMAVDLVTNTPVQGSLRGEFDSGSLGAIFLPVEHGVSGVMHLHGKLSGTTREPSMVGGMEWVDGGYIFRPQNIALAGIDMAAEAEYSPGVMAVNLIRLHGRDKHTGTMKAGGTIDFLTPSRTDVAVNLSQFYLIDSDIADGTVEADMRLRGQDGGFLMNGTIDLNEFNVNIPERFGMKIPQLNVIDPDDTLSQDSIVNRIELDITLNAPHRIFVRGWGLDAEFGGKLEVGGTVHAPQIHGEFEAVRGRYEEFGRRFSLDRARLRFQGTVPPSPYLDIKATTDTGDVMATVSLSGRVSEPKIGFSSVPALPEDEVVSRILFGRDMSRITPFQAIQLTQTLRRFSGQGGGGINPMGILRDVTGLDDISVETDEGGDTTVGVGKYLTDSIYMGVENSATNGSVATITMEVTPAISVQTKVGPEHGGGSVFWSRDY